MSESATSAAQAPVSCWRIAQLRFTAFSSGGHSSKGDALFHAFFDFPPDAETMRKAEFLSEFTATKGAVLYQLIVAGPKWDFIVSASPPEDGIATEIPALPDEGDYESQFRASAIKLIEGSPKIIRVAVGEQFLIPQPSREVAYAKMATFLPSVKIDPEGSSDFIYRINRARKLTLDNIDVTINRLSNWGCIKMERYHFQLPPTENNEQPRKIGEAVSLTTDINTSPLFQFSALSNEAKKKVIEVLFDYSKELADKGDIQ